MSKTSTGTTVVRVPIVDATPETVRPCWHRLLLHLGTWHDFPIVIACERPVVVLTANSDEVVEALASRTTAQEMDQGDVFKISLPQRLNAEIHLQALSTQARIPGGTPPPTLSAWKPSALAVG